MEDRKYILMLEKGDERAWRRLFDDNYAIMCHLAFQYVRDHFTAETLVDDVMADMWEKRNSIQVRTSLKAYLLSCVRNRCINYLRSFHIKNMQPLACETLLEPEVIDGSYPLGKMLDQELESVVREAVASLPDECRTVLLKSRVDGLRYEEIAAEMGISVNTVKYHMKNAFSILREKLGNYAVVFSLPVLLSVLSK